MNSPEEGSEREHAIKDLAFLVIVIVLITSLILIAIGTLK